MRVAALTLTAIAVAFSAVFSPSLVNQVSAHHTFTVSAARYRIPYADGTAVTANNDHHNHPNAVDRVDLGGPDLSTIVAAASGTIRAAVDRHGNYLGRGDGVAADGVTPQDDNLEEQCTDSDTVAGDCSDHNNFVWIEHPNGEWTKYSHFQTGTVTGDNGWSVGDTILVGQALGLQGEVGAATGPHLHFEVAEIPPGDPDTPSNTNGFVANSFNRVTQVCFGDDNGDDDGDGLYTDGEAYEARPCVNTAPTANAGGPYAISEGSTTQLDGTASSDPENAILSYSWAPATNLDDPTSATPTFSGVDDSVNNLTLTVNDFGGDVTAATQLTDSANVTVTVFNVPPTVNATSSNINEAGSTTVSATFTDPGVEDTHTATIDWDDGSPVQNVTSAQIIAGVNHVYGDNGSYNIRVTVTDDDGGSGFDFAPVTVANVDPVLTLDTSGEISFPGGDYMVVESGAELPASADGTDAGSDDLTFTWSVGDVNTYFNNGISPDPPESPFGTFPFAASDSIDAVYASPGVGTLNLTLTDDDGGNDNASANVIVTGNAENTQGQGWWKHQYSGNGSPHIDAATAQGYLDIVNAVSGIFSESTTVANFADLHGVLSPTGNDRRARARAELMIAWLQFASGAIDHDSIIPANSGPVDFLTLMTQSEAAISNPASTNSELLAVEQDLARVRHGQ
jgi:murein DD-endopeptidase MepM/ murein hydrolase activator NlpD